MKYTLNKIFLCISIVISINACHTFEHQNIFLQSNKNNVKFNLPKDENIIEKNDSKKSLINNEMAPINTPKKKEKVKKITLQKKIKNPDIRDYSLASFKDWSESKLIKNLGKGDFIKEEGKLKNHQYYFKECFLDIFLMRKNYQYFVNYIEKRPTKLNGAINTNACDKEIHKILN